METFFTLLALCAGNSPVTGEFPSQRPVMWSFDIFFDLSFNKRLSTQLRGWWFGMPSCSLWRPCNAESVYDSDGLVQVCSNFIANAQELLQSCTKLLIYETIYLTWEKAWIQLNYKFKINHDDVIKWKHFLRYWPFVQGIHRWIPLTKASDVGTLMFSLICSLKKWLSKQSWGWWFEMPLGSLWRHCNAHNTYIYPKNISLMCWNSGICLMCTTKKHDLCAFPCKVL